MGSCRNMKIACLSFMVCMVGLMKGATAANYVVGDSSGWILPSNTSFYSDWAASKTFQIGDVVTFNVTGNHTMAIATEEQYVNCSDPNSWITDGITTDVTLHSVGSLYFICTIGDNCEQGQKVNITVASGAHATALSLLLLLISSSLVISFTYK